MLFKSVSVLNISFLTFCLSIHPVLAEGVGKTGQLVSRERALMGTQVIVKVFGTDAERIDEAIEAAFAEVVRLEQFMSSFIPESELSKINRYAGEAPVTVSRELFELIRNSISFSERTAGAFDISFASVGKLWSFRRRIVPSAEAVAARLPFVDYRNIRLDARRSAVFLPHGSMEIGLGGIGKGYAMDRAIRVLEDFGIKNAVVMAGGDMLIRGKKGDTPWRVGLRNPNHQNEILAVLPLENQAISTSGDYERFFIKDGIRYHHILDTRTGFPADQSRSVSILAQDATTSDALSTSVFVLGPQKGMALIEALEGVEGIIIGPRGKVHLSSGLRTIDSKPAAAATQ
ncbi:MAG: FAD:protein FMN transferase [Nitrospiria bacterium]